MNLALESDPDDAKQRVEPAEVGHVGGEHAMVAGAGTEYHRRIDDIARLGGAAQLASRSGTSVIQWLDLDDFGGEQPHQANLAPPIPPHLGDDPGGYSHSDLALKGASDDRHDTTIVAFERDERTRVERQAGHDFRFVARRLPFSARSAARRSGAVSAPPVSASICCSSSAKSSSLAFSSSAAAT